MASKTKSKQSSGAKAAPNPRSKNWCFELYPDDNDNHKEILKLLKTGYRYLYIKHDRDVWDEDVFETDEETGEEKQIHAIGDVKKPHLHCILQFENARYKNGLVKEFGIEANLLYKLSSFNDYVVYLTHRDYPQKAQYDYDEFHGTLKKKAMHALSQDSALNELKEIVNFIDSTNGLVKYRALYDFVIEYGYLKTYRLYKSVFIVDLVYEHNEAYFKSKYHCSDKYVNKYSGKEVQ